jgi:hypothetical protein
MAVVAVQSKSFEFFDTTTDASVLMDLDGALEGGDALVCVIMGFARLDAVAFPTLTPQTNPLPNTWEYQAGFVPQGPIVYLIESVTGTFAGGTPMFRGFVPAKYNTVQFTFLDLKGVRAGLHCASSLASGSVSFPRVHLNDIPDSQYVLTPGGPVITNRVSLFTVAAIEPQPLSPTFHFVIYDEGVPFGGVRFQPFIGVAGSTTSSR